MNKQIDTHTHTAQWMRPEVMKLTALEGFICESAKGRVGGGGLRVLAQESLLTNERDGRDAAYKQIPTVSRHWVESRSYRPIVILCPEPCSYKFEIQFTWPILFFRCSSTFLLKTCRRTQERGHSVGILSNKIVVFVSTLNCFSRSLILSPTPSLLGNQTNQHGMIHTHKKQRVTLGGCKHASELSKTQNGGFGPRADVVSDLAGIFSEGISKLKMTETADNLHAMSCHSKRLPCTPKVRGEAELSLFLLLDTIRFGKKANT